MLHLERRRAAAYGHHLHGILANHEHALGFRRVDGEHTATVLKQHDALIGNGACRAVVLIGAQETASAVWCHSGAEVQAQHTAHLIVEFGLRVLAIVYGLEVRIGEEIVVVGVGGTHSQTVSPCAELHVEAVLDGLVEVVCAAPVAHHHAVETPLTLENVVYEILVVAVVLVLV